MPYKQNFISTTEPSARKPPINTEMISREMQASSRKNGSKFDIIKTVASLKKAQKPGSS